MADSKSTHHFTPSDFIPRQALVKPEHYAEFVGDGAETVAAISLAQMPAIPVDAIIHDNGCGKGSTTAAIMAAVSPEVAGSIKITATDIDPDVVEVYRARSISSSWPAEASVMDADALSFPDETFTHSIASAMIFIGPRNNGIDAVKEMHRTLKPGGTLMVNCFGYHPSLEPIREASRATRSPDTIPKWDSFEHWQDPAVLTRIVEAGGFEKVNVQQREMFVNVGNFNRHTTLTWSLRGQPSVGWSKQDEERWDEAVGVVRRELRKTKGFKILEDGTAVVRIIIIVATATK